MTDDENNDKTEEIKKTLLRFASSELTSHASTTIGFSVILFAFLNVITQFYGEDVRIPFTLRFCLSTATLRYLFIFIILVLINTAIVYVVMRLVYYGRLAHEVIHYEKSADSLGVLMKAMVQKVNETKFCNIISLEWFSQGIAPLSIGFWFSFVASSVMSLILFWIFLFE